VTHRGTTPPVAQPGLMKFVWSKEAQHARRSGRLVALETSVLAQGLPYPRNLEAARRCEAAVREAGATPAAIAVIDGRLHVGLSDDETERLATGKHLLKVGSRDLALAIATKATGGTTVSATCELAAHAGIAVFATGGLGGVHRGVAEDLDISQDLPALARWPVAVVCAGAKSVLDLPKTLELLETLGVPVIGVGTNELPGFYCRETGLALEHSVPNAKVAARVVEARQALGQGGLVFAVPPPESTALPRRAVETHLKAALALAKRRRVAGKAVTPFLLAEMVRRSGGRTLEANLALLENNARFAGQLAVALR
jgi:pseudouridylate synthase